MRTLALVSLTLLLIASPAFAGMLVASIDPTSLPAVVQSSIASGYPGGTVTEASTEAEDGVTTYVAIIKVGDRTWEVDFSPDGKELEHEEVIAASSLPAPVQATLAKFRGWTVVRVGREKEGTYVVQLQKGKTKMEVGLSAAGRVERREREDE